MKNGLIGCLFFLSMGLCVAQSPSKPNVIIIMADDMGFSDISCFGGEIPTPNLDKLAANGVRLSNFYNTGRCCPSRASLLTGVYPQEAGVGYMIDPIENNPSYQGFLNKETVTFAEAMQEAGYFTAISGKWHVGHKEGQRPDQRGFMRSLAAPVGGFMYTGQPRAQIFLNGKLALPGVDMPNHQYVTDLWTDFGLQFIDEAQATNTPFLLYLAHNAPHFPLQAPDEDIARFKGKYMRGWEQLREERYNRQREMNLLGQKYELGPMNPKIPKWDSLSLEEKERYDLMMAIYAAMVSHLDESIGRLVNELEKKGILDNTLILFFSDNGGNAESGVKGITQGDTLGNRNSNVFLGQCWAELNNTPFWLYKHHTSEGGIASPFIAHWPQGIPKKRNGEIIHEPAHIVDIMPTLLDIGGGTYPSLFHGNTIKKPRGISLNPVFKGKKVNRTEPIFWEHEGNRAIRVGDWKAVSNLTESWQLYNMAKDRAELKDVSMLKPSILNDLVRKYEEWYQQVGAKPYFKEPMKWQSTRMEYVKSKE